MDQRLVHAKEKKLGPDRKQDQLAKTANQGSGTQSSAVVGLYARASHNGSILGSCSFNLLTIRNMFPFVCQALTQVCSLKSSYWSLYRIIRKISHSRAPPKPPKPLLQRTKTAANDEPLRFPS